MNNLGMRRKKYRRTRRRRRRRQRGGGKKKAADKTRKLVKNARMRAREKTRKAREETRKFDEMMELFGHNNSNEFSYSNEYSSENDTPKKRVRTPSPLIREGQVRRDVQTNGNAHQLASALGAYPRRRSPSPLPTFDVDEYFVSAAEAEEGVGFADILPIGSEIVGHGKRANGIRFYKVRMGPKNIPKGFKNAGKAHTKQYADSKSYVKEFDAVFPRGNGPFLEDEAEGLPELEKLVMDYIAKHPVAGAGGIYGENSNSNGGGRRRKRRKKRTRRKRRSRKTRRRRRRRRKQRAGWICPCGSAWPALNIRGAICQNCGNFGPTALETHQAGVAIQRAWRAKRSRRDGKDEHGQRRRKQRGGFDPIPKFRYKPKVFLNASAPKEAPIPPKPWW